jgi:hypothetical protein
MLQESSPSLLFSLRTNGALDQPTVTDIGIDLKKRQAYSINGTIHSFDRTTDEDDKNKSMRTVPAKIRIWYFPKRILVRYR